MKALSQDEIRSRAEEIYKELRESNILVRNLEKKDEEKTRAIYELLCNLTVWKFSDNSHVSKTHVSDQISASFSKIFSETHDYSENQIDGLKKDLVSRLTEKQNFEGLINSGLPPSFNIGTFNDNRNDNRQITTTVSNNQVTGSLNANVELGSNNDQPRNDNRPWYIKIGDRIASLLKSILRWWEKFRLKHIPPCV